MRTLACRRHARQAEPRTDSVVLGGGHPCLICVHPIHLWFKGVLSQSAQIREICGKKPAGQVALTNISPFAPDSFVPFCDFTFPCPPG